MGISEWANATEISLPMLLNTAGNAYDYLVRRRALEQMNHFTY